MLLPDVDVPETLTLQQRAAFRFLDEEGKESVSVTNYLTLLRWDLRESKG